MRRIPFIVTAVFILSLHAVPAWAASDEAQVRFVHAVPMVGTATIEVDGKPVGEVGFGESTELASVPAGKAPITLTAPGGVELSADAKLAAGKGYLGVALATGKSAELRLFPSQSATPGDARLRMIHAAPELGDADLSVGGKTVAEGAGYTDDTGYLKLAPGEYDWAVEDPASGKAVLAGTAPLAAGTAQTALVVGSEGEQTDVVLVEDDVAAPAGAPQTGFGGLDGPIGGPDWALVLLAALGAGLIGMRVSNARRQAPNRNG